MSRLYIDELEKFALSVDIVNSEIWNSVMDHSFTDFLKAQKIVRSAGFLVPDPIRDTIFLDSVWFAKGKDFHGEPFRKDVSEYEKEGHTLFAYVKKKSIWVVDKDKKPLHLEDCNYVDLFKNATYGEIPRFVLWPKGSGNHVKTSICIPDKLGAIGVLNIELKEYLEPTEQIKAATIKMAESIHLLYGMYANRLKSSKNAVSAAMQLRKFVNIPRHSYFISYNIDNDAKEADHIEAFLWRNERDVKRDVKGLHGGERIEKELYEMINESDTFIAIWSSDYKESGWCMDELSHARNRNRRNRRPFRIIQISKDKTPIPEGDLREKLYFDGSSRPLREICLPKIINEETNCSTFLIS